jgi:hypothetical protein
MLLSRGQLDYINRRRNEIEDILKLEPKKGWLALKFEWDLLNNMMYLHNIAAREEYDATVANSTDSKSKSS